MSHGNPEETQHAANPHVRSAINSAFITIFLLGGLYLLGGRELWESSGRINMVLETQESDQQQIRDNSALVGRIQQGLDDLRSAGDHQRLNVEETRERLSEVEKILAPLTLRINETRQAIDAAASRDALQNAQTIAVLALADKCEQALSRMKELTVQWDREYATLLTNDRGRQIASDQESLQKYIVAVAGDFPTVEDSIQGFAEYQEAVRPLRNAEAQGIDDFSTVPDARTFFESLLTRVQKANQRLEQRQRTVDVILATSSEHPSGKLSLEASIQNYQQQQLISRLETAIEDRQVQLKKVIDAQADAFVATQEKRILAEAALKRQKEELRTNAANRETERLANEDAMTQKKYRQEQLEKEFEIEKGEIHRLLGIFLSKGSQQPAPNFSLDSPNWHIIDRGPGPISLGRLASIGALDPTDEGYELLYRIGGDPFSDRPRSGFPNYTKQGFVNPTVIAKVKRASELLNKYGDLLVKKRLLAP